MKTLTTYKKNDHEFTFVRRDGNVAIFYGKSTKGPTDTWEVIHIQSHEGREFGEKFYPASEFCPSNAQWGVKGWTCTDETSANARFDREVLAVARLNSKKDK